MFAANVAYEITETEQKRRILNGCREIAAKKQTLEVSFPDHVIHDSDFIKIHTDGTPIVKQGIYNVSRVVLKDPYYTEMPPISMPCTKLTYENFFSTILIASLPKSVSHEDPNVVLPDDKLDGVLSLCFNSNRLFVFDKDPSGEEYYNTFIQSKNGVLDLIKSMREEVAKRYPKEKKLYDEYSAAYDSAKETYEAEKTQLTEDKRIAEEKNDTLRKEFILKLAELTGDEYLNLLIKHEHMVHDRFYRAMYNHLMDLFDLDDSEGSRVDYDAENPSLELLKAVDKIPDSINMFGYDLQVESAACISLDGIELVWVAVHLPEFFNDDYNQPDILKFSYSFPE